MRDHLEGNAPNYEVEYRIKMKLGDYKWFRDVGRITEMDNDTDYKKITGIVIDIDKRKKAEIKLRDALNRSNFYKDLLAHDMANILNIIKSSMRLREMWKNEPEQSDNREELKENIFQQLERGGTLISNVRKISNLEEGKNQLKPLELISILENAIEQTYSRFREGILKINYDFPDDPIKIVGGDLLLDAFENILLNGALHNENKIKKLWIELSNIRKRENKFLKIEFKDNGIGISDERKKKLFEKSYQKEESSVGMGIGLSLVKKIIKEYEGDIWVENRVEDDYRQGSNFVILLKKP
jgi:signal transduction histidine kinase